VRSCGCAVVRCKVWFPLTSVRSIIQRAGIVPLSIAGIFKEISTISFSAWLFGDRLTELNIIGVVIAIGGITLYTYHKYQKSIMSPVPLDKHGRPIEEEALVHEHMLDQSESGGYERAPMGEFEMGEAARRASSGSQRRESGLGLGPTQTQGQGRSKTGSGLVAETETHEDRVERTTSDFEGWNDDWREDDDEEDEVADEEVERLRAQREGSGMGEQRKGSVLGRSWGDWWEKEM
jgi:solute carrier family 35 protein C2